VFKGEDIILRVLQILFLRGYCPEAVFKGEDSILTMLQDSILTVLQSLTGHNVRI